MTWKLLNEIINKKRIRPLPSVFMVNNLNVSNPLDVANHFCDYFTNIGPSLVRNVSIATNMFYSFLTENFQNSLFLRPANELEIIDIVSSLRKASAGGYYNVPMQIVKDSIDLISEPLTRIINLSIETGIVPNEM